MDRLLLSDLMHKQNSKKSDWNNMIMVVDTVL